MKKKYIFIIFIFMSGCQLNTSSTSTDKCIAPLYENRNEIVNSNILDLSYEQIPPDESWQKKSDLPFIQSDFSHLYYRSEYNDLWLVDNISGEIYRYQITEMKWNVYNTIDEVSAVPHQLIITDNNEIWGADIYFIDQITLDQNFPLLCKFDDTKNQFVYVADNDNILDSFEFSISSNIVESPTGDLWFFVQKYQQTTVRYSLLKFDTETAIATEEYSMRSGGSTHLTLDPNGNIWFINRSNNIISQFSALDQTIRSYRESQLANPLEYDLFSNDIFSDNHGDIWFGNQSWVDYSNEKNPKLNYLSHVPIYKSQIYDFDGVPSIDSPISMYQDSKDKYWFSGFFGVLNYDKQREKWCLITTGASNIVEDDNHNLWIAVYDHLYSYKLE